MEECFLHCAPLCYSIDIIRFKPLVYITPPGFTFLTSIQFSNYSLTSCPTDSATILLELSPSTPTIKAKALLKGKDNVRVFCTGLNPNLNTSLILQTMILTAKIQPPPGSVAKAVGIPKDRSGDSVRVLVFSQVSRQRF